MDVETYETLRDATLLLTLLDQGEAEIRRGEVVSTKAAFAKARQRVRDA